MAQAGLSCPSDAEEIVALLADGGERAHLPGEPLAGPATSLATVAPGCQRLGCCRDVPAGGPWQARGADRAEPAEVLHPSVLPDRLAG
jgi:hypothetical protein